MKPAVRIAEMAPATSGRLYAIVDEGRERGLPHSEVLQVERLREPLEQPLAAAQDDRRDDDGQLVDDSGLECLADGLGSALDVDALVAGRLARPLHSRLASRHEAEIATLGLLLRPVRHDEERQAPGVLVAPVPSCLVGPAPAHDGPDPGRGLRQPLGVLPGGPALRLVVVRPGPAEHPVVEPLAALAEALARPVVRPGDVPVDRCRDTGKNLRHQRAPLLEVEEDMPWRPCGDAELIAAPRRVHRPRPPAALTTPVPTPPRRCTRRGRGT